MKKFVVFCLICVIFVLIFPQKLPVSACSDEQIDFIYNNKIFSYQLENNVKKSNVFDENFKINRYNRFGSKVERQNLLEYMLKVGFDKEVALEYIFPNLVKKINQIEKNISLKPRDAKIKIDTNSQKVFHISNEVVGITVDKQKLLSDICENFLKNNSFQIKVPTKTLYPQVFKRDFEKFTNLRAEFSTNIANSTADRKHNIKNALKRLNKIEIAPNEIFSFNKTIGRRTKENGYREAKIIVNNEFVDGVGGGVCQVSSTLYNAALLSGLEIIEANKHSKQVGYVKYGFDAMVNFGSSDLKFRNNTSQKITIITNFSSDNLRIRIFGQNLGNTTYKLTNEIVSTTDPIEIVELDTENKYQDKVIYEDESFYLKKATKGMEVKSYREIYVNGKLTDKQLLRFDKFNVQNAIKIYGTKKRTELDASFDLDYKTAEQTSLI